MNNPQPEEAATKSWDPRLAGSSEEATRVRSRICSLGPLREPVLVLGETGSPQDAVAAALHERGLEQGSLSTLDCATSGKEADGLETQTLHLKGVHHLTTREQTFWSDRLRELERTAYRKGPRVVASAPLLFANLADPIFHVDLRKQLGRFPIRLSPLRERPRDIPEIATRIIEEVSHRMQRKARLTTSAKNFLGKQPWPHNEAQLSLLLERAVAFTPEYEIGTRLLQEANDDLEDSLASIRRDALLEQRSRLFRTLKATHGNISKTARALGHSRSTIYRQIERHGIALSEIR